MSQKSATSPPTKVSSETRQVVHKLMWPCTLGGDGIRTPGNWGRLLAGKNINTSSSYSARIRPSWKPSVSHSSVVDLVGMRMFCGNGESWLFALGCYSHLDAWAGCRHSWTLGQVQSRVLIWIRSFYEGSWVKVNGNCLFKTPSVICSDFSSVGSRLGTVSFPWVVPVPLLPSLQ